MAHVRVVLREDVQHVGAVGELVRVRAGFARNFLLPRGMAALATAGSIRQIEDHKRQALARTEAAGKLNGLTVTISRQAGESDRLYGAVTSKDVAEALQAKGHEIDKKDLVLSDAIKALGEHAVTVKLGSGVDATIKVIVTKSN